MAPPHGEHQTSRPKSSRWMILARLVLILPLTACASPISQLTLAPSFGQIPSSVNHSIVILVTCFLGLNIRTSQKSWRRTLQYLAVWTFWIPVIQWALIPFNGRLGPIGGPIVNGFLSCHTIIVPSASVLASLFDASDLGASMGSLASGFKHPVAMLLPFAFLDRPLMKLFSSALVRIATLTPVHLQLLLASAYSVLAPSWLLLLAIPALIHGLLFNPHVSNDAVDMALSPAGWALIDRQWSNTGYISVLENMDEKYRVLRCDHSLLGGEWLLTPERIRDEGWKVEEPVYAVFEMLEAIRLIEVDPPIADDEAQALIIGLGIGTAPKACIAHGINTTIVELDPVVHKFATQYFALPENHTPVIQDAVSWVSATASEAVQKYDYIIHDVFTGGAEPLALFNTYFLSNLRGLLKVDGLIAVNYAGDLSLPLTRLVLRTISEVFERQCRVFRDSLPDEGSFEGDFLNMIVFCRNTEGNITFRDPVAADFLGSKSRQHYMFPKPEHEMHFPAGENEAGAEHVLQPQHEKHWNHEQIESAQRHWRIIRTVVPDIVWDIW